MKKIIITAIIAIASFTTYAQSSWEAGLRLGNGGSNHYGTVAIDATVPLGAPRLHMTGYFGHDFTAGFYFDWLFTLSGASNNLKFYPGFGPELYFGNEFNFGVAGNFGIEYTFDFPLTIGIDWRPAVPFVEDTKLYADNLGLMARFRFGGSTFQRSR